MAPRPAPPPSHPHVCRAVALSSSWRGQPPAAAVAHHCPVKARPLTEPTESVESVESPHVRAFLRVDRSH
jgi:hypothetical protein